MKKTTNTDVQEWNVLDHLKTNEEISKFLSAAAEENDADYLMSALGSVAKAKGINEMAEKMNVNRESLYKSFNGKSKPRFETVMKAFDALGLKMEISIKEQACNC